MSNEYTFRTVWRVTGSAAEIAHVIADGADLVRWWPSVYLKAVVLEAGDETGVGRTIDLYTKGLLPYTLRWSFIVTEVEMEKRLALTATGDFVGHGVWTFEQEGETAVVTYDWQVRADKPLLRRLSFLMRPIFEANHRWAMAMGERSLVLELQRRHAASPEARAAVPPPPGPTSPLPFYAGSAAVGAFLVLSLRRLKRR